MYYCKTCGQSRFWRRCEKCGTSFCYDCLSKGKGNYPKLKASNICPYCNKISTFGFEHLKGSEDFLADLAKKL